jgi:hypothetical protein
VQTRQPRAFGQTERQRPVMAQRRGEPGLDIGQIGSAAIDRDHPLARIEQDMPLGKMMPEPRRIGRGRS